MSIGDLDKKLLIGILVGVTLGVASALLFAPGQRSRRRDSALDRARDAVRANPPHDRKIARAGRTLTARLERMRSAGL